MNHVITSSRHTTSTLVGLLLILGALLAHAARADAPLTKTLYGADRQVVLVGRLTSPMGYTDRTIDTEPRYHTGIDIAAPRGTPVFAPADGLVVTAGERPAFGNVVELLSDGKTLTLFAHLDSYDVDEGQRIEAGDLIGRVGSTGVSSGPHVHIETHVDGRRVDPKTVWQLTLSTWR